MTARECRGSELSLMVQVILLNKLLARKNPIFHYNGHHLIACLKKLLKKRNKQ